MATTIQCKQAMPLVTIAFLALVTGCQSTKLASLPGAGWLQAKDQPPTLAADATAYPPPSAVATPATLGDTKSGVAATPSAPPSFSVTPNTPAMAATNPPAAAIPRPTTPAPSQVDLASASLPTDTGFNPQASPAVANEDIPVGLPPGVSAPNIEEMVGQTAEQLANQAAATTQQIQAGPYEMLPSSPSQTTLAAASSAGSPTNSSLAAADYQPMPQSSFNAQSSAVASSAAPPNNPAMTTTWDHPMLNGDNASESYATDSRDSDFVANSSTEASTPSTIGSDTARIATTIPESSSASNVAYSSNAGSHYAAIAQQSGSGPWRPGSTTEYQPQTASVPQNGAGVSNIPSTW